MNRNVSFDVCWQINNQQVKTKLVFDWLLKLTNILDVDVGKGHPMIMLSLCIDRQLFPSVFRTNSPSSSEFDHGVSDFRCFCSVVLCISQNSFCTFKDAVITFTGICLQKWNKVFLAFNEHLIFVRCSIWCKEFIYVLIKNVPQRSLRYRTWYLSIISKPHKHLMSHSFYLSSLSRNYSVFVFVVILKEAISFPFYHKKLPVTRSKVEGDVCNLH